jgi:hypothetical protein
MRIVVDLPAPFGPSKPNISPRSIWMSTPSTAVNMALGSFFPNSHRLFFGLGADPPSIGLSPVPGRAGNFLTSWWASTANCDMVNSFLRQISRNCRFYEIILRFLLIILDILRLNFSIVNSNIYNLNIDFKNFNKIPLWGGI